MTPSPRTALGRQILQGRRARGWTQADLGGRAGVSRSLISAIETGAVGVGIPTLECLAKALDADLIVELRLPTVIGRSEQADAAHARCVAAARRALERRGFLCAVECEIADGRLRGWIDLLAFNPVSGRLLVIEVKTELRDVGGLQRQLGWYRRAAPAIARSRGWQARDTVAVAVFLATDANDSALLTHRDSIMKAFEVRGRAAIAILVGSETVSPPGGWALAMIDPRRRGDRVWAATRLDGRRAPAPYRSYADFMAVTTGR